jgi:hypothetical protein
VTVESVTYISDLNATYPAAGDAKSEGDDHIRNIKTGIKATFPNVNGAVSATDEDLNQCAGLATANGSAAATEIGYRGLPLSQVNAAYTLVITDRGKMVQQTADFDITVPNSIFSSGTLIEILNTSGSSISIIQGTGVTLTDSVSGSTGTRTLANKGWARIFFVDAANVYLWGAGVS